MAIKIKLIIFALLAAIFYAINIPISKDLLNSIGSIMLASFLYLGAGIGIGLFIMVLGTILIIKDTLSSKNNSWF